MEFEITYIGMDGAEHTESHIGNRESLARLVTFLEERGAHCIFIEPIEETPPANGIAKS